MPKRGDLDLNSIYSCTASLKQSLRHTMLNQELAFMRQVNELHQLYKLQIDMMEDSTWKRFDDYNLHRGGMKLISEYKNCLAQCSEADFARFGNFNFQHEQCTRSAVMQKPLDLQLSADEFMSRYGSDSLGKEPPTVSLKNFFVSKDFSRGITVSDVHNLKLSLSIGHDAGDKVKGHRSLEANKTSASSSEVIDLEDPFIRFPNNDACLELAPRFAATKFSSKDKLESFSKIEMNHVPYGTPASAFVLDVGPSCQRQTPSYPGCIGHHREFLCADLLCENQISGTSKANKLDLNMVQYEDSLCPSNNFSTVHNPLKTSSSGVPDKVYTKHTIASSASLTSWKKANVIDLSESSVKHRQLDLNIDLTHSCGENNGEDWNKDDKFRVVDRGGICYIDLDSDSDEPCSSSRSNPKIESVDSSSKLSNDLSCNVDLVDAVEADVNEERDAEPHAQNQSADEHPNFPKVSSSSDSDHINDDQSNSLKTMQSVAKCGDLNFSGSESDESQKATVGTLADNLGEPDQKSSDSTESNIQCIKSNKLEADVMIQSAAESLVQISSETRVSHLGSSPKEFRDKDNQPQCSSDSYEKMVLWAKESDFDDFCVSSNAFVVDGSENKGSSRYKLKRGSRMKDFQKDVLPSLSILSRHEISEDINIMEGVIRSREYRKMRAKMGDDGDWFRPGRSKRSRAGYNRRYCL